ncbi:unnamed protein product [Oncorhynchus mykiss]|uniref:Uncharacterized protein n=1 Tax=Oncorhynchus mykiss TaxID=8022 RepID=A0A060YVG7_ONCMY|nr:unnamed protein product [Oncorhynchus mykiss]
MVTHVVILAHFLSLYLTFYRHSYPERQEQLGLSALLKGISTDISPVGSGIQPSNLSVNGPTLLTLPPASFFLSLSPSLPLSQASDVIEDLEQTVAQLRQQLQDSEHRRLKQLGDTENKLQQEKADLQHHCEKKVRALHNEAEKEREETKKKISKLEESLK